MELSKTEQPNIDAASLYSILGVSKDATTEEIRLAYKRLAGKHHPDKKGGDETAFKLIKQAYDVLSDDVKRQVYDASGEYEDVGKVAQATELVTGAVMGIVNNNAVDLKYIDIVGTLKHNLARDIQEQARTLAQLEKLCVRLEKHKGRAKDSLIRGVFEKSININQQKQKEVTDIRDVFELALGLVMVCGYDFEEEPVRQHSYAGFPVGRTDF